MLAHARRGTADGRLVALEPRGGLGLPHASHRWLIELRDDLARYNLRMVDDLASAQYWCTRNVGGIEATVVSDGLIVGVPKDTFVGPAATNVEKMMTDLFLPPRQAGDGSERARHQHRR